MCLVSVDFMGAGTLITAKFLELPGCVPDLLTNAQSLELERKRINYYAGPEGAPILGEGTCLAPGIWINSQVWFDWVV